MYQATLELSQYFENNFRYMENLPFAEASSELNDLRKKVKDIEN
jgi:hypothetical protein